MSSLYVKVYYGDSTYRIFLQPSSSTVCLPSFQALCEALIDQLNFHANIPSLLDPTHSPYLVFCVGEDGYHRVLDDLSFRKAIKLANGKNRIALRVLSRRRYQREHVQQVQSYAHKKVMNPLRETGKFSVQRKLICSKHKCYSTVYLLSPSRLLKLFQDFRQHNDVSSVSLALNHLDQCINHHDGDSSALRHRRYDLASLFSEFLAEAVLPVSGCVSTRLRSRFGAKLQKVLREFGVSVYTSESAAEAVAVVFRCKRASQNVRRLYSRAISRAIPRCQTSAAEKLGHRCSCECVALRNAPQTAGDAAPTPDPNSAADSDQEHLPVSYYLNEINQLRNVAETKVKRSFRRLKDAYKQSGQDPSFKPSRKLCRKIEHAVFHYLRKNVSDPQKAVHKRMGDELAAIVVRKLVHAGLDEGFIDETSRLVVMMAYDDAVRELAWQWANMEKMQTTTALSAKMTDQKVSTRYSSTATESADKHHDRINKDSKSQSLYMASVKIRRKSDVKRPKPSTPAYLSAPAESSRPPSSKHARISDYSQESDSSLAKRRTSFRNKHKPVSSESRLSRADLEDIFRPRWRQKILAKSNMPQDRVDVVIDGRNVAKYYGSEKPQWHLLVNVLRDYEQYGMKAVPALWEKDIKDFRSEAEKRLKNVYFSVVPEKEDDDLNALFLAHEENAIILSNDQFRDHIRFQFTPDASLRLAEFVQRNRLSYTIKGDKFFPGKSRGGPRIAAKKQTVRKDQEQK
ncbi:unnamed protein product [Chondrus crispus]|uniref:RNase NYN domain-containing protein n=1 Tax=Chondrus crispus TaxID=2769 RepID=R7Q3K0_CHOCR|nr:unnamed protein product [Chondrus crispus]CDF32589.1 unnamed protein product [Chondrus crispus]|eukprot:XP_005712360.1 unnamed protein product [Chondrus crispus]